LGGFEIEQARWNVCKQNLFIPFFLFFKMKKGKKAISPLISTILLVMIVIVLALIIIAWSGVFLQEAITKEIGGVKKTAEQRCLEISIETFVNQDAGKSFGFKNTGNIPLYAYNVKLFLDDGSSEMVYVPSSQGGIVNPGYNTLVEEPGVGPLRYIDYEQVKIIPIILGKDKSGETQQFTCPESDSFVV